ncbi:MAG: hypothetical protein U5R31_15100 [Acidimicrobiia bacterium]|nr:hypothetical protein [Acidimicrobiia bacterium]
MAWFHRGSDGGFEYWPDGPGAPSTIHEGDIHNTAVVGDNDFMWHRVRPLGRPEDGMESLSLDSELVTDDGTTWTVTDPERGEVATFDRDRLRVSLSWKAVVFDSEEDRRRHDDHLDDLSAGEVLRRISADLAERRARPDGPRRRSVPRPGLRRPPPGRVHALPGLRRSVSARGRQLPRQLPPVSLADVLLPRAIGELLAPDRHRWRRPGGASRVAGGYLDATPGSVSVHRTLWNPTHRPGRPMPTSPPRPGVPGRSHASSCSSA